MSDGTCQSLTFFYYMFFRSNSDKRKKSQLAQFTQKQKIHNWKISKRKQFWNVKQTEFRSAGSLYLDHRVRRIHRHLREEKALKC